MFVAKKDPKSNAIFVVPGSFHPALYVNTIYVLNFRWIWGNDTEECLVQPSGVKALIKYRHCMEPEGCMIYWDDHSFRVTLDNAQKGIAPGQVATLYLGDWCLGCGVITGAEFHERPLDHGV
ncbi:hypothetical protein ID866_2169 [Astraeus odoratus]|nr:hypothetical protein ID866_2169 [Astraeus odoratus]